MEYNPDTIQINPFHQHLIERLESMYLPVKSNEFIDWQEELLSAILTDFSGKMNGYQLYNWKSDKTKRNDEKGRYWSIRPKAKEGCSVFGLRYFLNKSNYIAITEGIFDAITCMGAGLDSIAVLSNGPKYMRQQLRLLDRPTVAICQGDKPSEKLIKYCDDYIILPEDTDANDLGIEKMNTILYSQGIVGKMNFVKE